MSSPNASVTGRNSPCPCGSGKKYKRCCGQNEPQNGPQGKEPVPSVAAKTNAPALFALPRPLLIFLDWVLLPFLIVSFAYEPNFAHGLINYNELGQYLSAINGLSHGQHLYRDIFVQYNPLQYYVPLWAMQIFGMTLPVLKGYFLFGEIFTFLVLYVLSRRLIPNRFFSYLGSLFIVIEAHHPFWSLNWGGARFGFIYLSFFFLLAFTRDSKSLSMFLAGLFASAGFLHTYDSGAVSYFAGAMLIAGYGFWLPRTDKSVTFPKVIGPYVAGCLTLMIPFALFLLATDSLPAYLTQLKDLGPGRAVAQPFTKDDLTLKVLYPGIVYLLSFGLLILRTARRGRSPANLFLGTVTACGLLLYLFSFRAIRGPQFETALPPAVLIAFYLLGECYTSFKSIARDRILARFLLLAIVIGGIGYHVYSEKRFYGKGLVPWLGYQEAKSVLLGTYRKSIPKNLGTEPLNFDRGGGSVVANIQADEINQTVAYLTSHTGPDDALFGFPDLGIFNFFCDRPQATRFYIGALANPKKEWRDELLADLLTKKPRIVLMNSRLSTIAQALGRTTELMPEVSEAIAQHYRLARKIGSLSVYERS